MGLGWTGCSVLESATEGFLDVGCVRHLLSLFFGEVWEPSPGSNRFLRTFFTGAALLSAHNNNILAKQSWINKVSNAQRFTICHASIPPEIAPLAAGPD